MFAFRLEQQLVLQLLCFDHLRSYQTNSCARHISPENSTQIQILQEEDHNYFDGWLV